MHCTEVLKARVSSLIKRQARAIAERDLLTESAWLKRLVIREIRACDAANDDEGELHRENDIHRPGEARGPKGYCKPVYVRFRDEDRLLLDARSAADIKKAYDAIDQILDLRQQAKFRVFEENMERRKLELVTRARQANQANRGRQQ